MTLTYTITQFALLVGGGTVQLGPVRIVVTATPGTPDKHLDPVDGSAERERVVG